VTAIMVQDLYALAFGADMAPFNKPKDRLVLTMALWQFS